MAKIKKEEIVLGGEAYISPQLWMPSVDVVADNPKPPLYVTIIGSILMAVAIPAVAIWGSVFVPSVKNFASVSMARMEASWGSLFVPSAQVLVEREKKRIEEICAMDKRSKECRYLKAVGAAKAAEGRSWPSKKQ